MKKRYIKINWERSSPPSRKAAECGLLVDNVEVRYRVHKNGFVSIVNMDAMTEHTVGKFVRRLINISSRGHLPARTNRKLIARSKRALAAKRAAEAPIKFV